VLEFLSASESLAVWLVWTVMIFTKKRSTSNVG
jgi:hypothetical protein